MDVDRSGGKISSRFIKRLKVLDRHFVYNPCSTVHCEVDVKTWGHLGRTAFCEEESVPPEVLAVLETAAPPARPSAFPELKSIIFQVSHACNLRCRYCNADFGRYGGGAFRMMSLETARKGIDFLFENSGSRRIAINYFGGEPLLNFSTVLDSARYALERAEAEGRELALHLVTNGVLLSPETIFLLDDLGFTLTVSLDGPPVYHNKARPFADGAGSFGPTARALHMMTKLPIGRRVTVRGTFTRDSAYFFPLAKFLVRAGLSKNIAYEPVFLPSHDRLSLRWRDLGMVKKAYVDLAEYYVSRWRAGEPFCLWDFDDALTQLALGIPRRSRCGAGATTVALTAEGDLYACHMSTGMREARVGSLDGGFDEERRSSWLERYIAGRAGCSGCWLEKLCGGGCNTHALLYNKDISQPYRLECKLIEHRYRLAFRILAEIPGLREAIRACHPLAHLEMDSGHDTIPLWSCKGDNRWNS